MKLWLISQNVNNGYDTYDSAVVAAETEEEARTTYPSDWSPHQIRWDPIQFKWLWHINNCEVRDYGSSDWAPAPAVKVEFLADGYNGPARVILASFNAG
jgi:hypothetical protein